MSATQEKSLNHMHLDTSTYSISAVFQAEQQLGPGWTLMRAGTPKCPEIQDWLASNLPDQGRVGIDPFLHTVCSFS